MPGGQEDPALAEVKAILQKLQRLDLPEAPADSAPEAARPSNADEEAPEGSGASVIAVFARKQAALTAKPPAAETSKRGAPLAAILLVALFTAAAAWYFTFGTPPWVSPEDPKKPGYQTSKDETQILSDARRLIGEGMVMQSRQTLLKASPETHADFALLLAQTYDPNYLTALSKSDAKPDKTEASRWYRVWHALAVKNGLELDSDRLQRIINAMH